MGHAAIRRLPGILCISIFEALSIMLSMRCTMSTDVHIFQNTSATTRSAIRSRDPKRSTRQTKRSRKLDSATRHTCACAGECHGVTLDSSPLATRLSGLLTVSPPTCMCSPPADPLRVSRQSVISTLEDVVTTCHRSWAALRLRERGVRSNMVRCARRAHAAAWVLEELHTR